MKSIFGLSENVVAALSYIAGPFSGIAVLVMERENKFVRFHALQSTIWFTLILIVGWVLGFIANLPIPILGWLLGIIVRPVIAIGGFAAFLSMVYLMAMAASSKTFKIPIIGNVVWAQINK